MPSLDEIEKYFWQTLIAVIVGLPLIIITTTKDKIIWILIYTLLILILGTLFSIIKQLKLFCKNRYIFNYIF